MENPPISSSCKTPHNHENPVADEKEATGEIKSPGILPTEKAEEPDKKRMSKTVQLMLGTSIYRKLTGNFPTNRSARRFAAKLGRVAQHDGEAAFRLRPKRNRQR